MTTMTVFDVKSLEQQNMAAHANRVGWLVESVAESKRTEFGGNLRPETLRGQAGVILAVILALLVLGSVTVA
jgi:hypothetical protein